MEHDTEMSRNVTRLESGVTLTWEHLSVTMHPRRSRSKFFSWFCRSNTDDIHAEDRTPVFGILNNVSGSVLPGEVIALIGSSGAGKSTLLNLLSGLALPGRVENPRSGSLYIDGDIRLNGYIPTKSMKRLTGYVRQNDIMYPFLKVKETVGLSALIRLPDEEFTDSQKIEIADQILSQLGLIHANERIVSKEISGGERKRTCIATELVTHPILLFLDEPTSGLDAFTAQYTIQLLRDIATRANKSILLTIHQPRFHILELFDRVFILSMGRMIFQGTVNEAIEYFSELDHIPPVNVNPADHFIDIVTLDRRTPESERASREEISRFAMCWDRIEEQRSLGFPSIRIPINEADTNTVKIPESFIRVSMTIPSQVNPVDLISTKWPISRRKEFALLLRRNLIDTFRNRRKICVESVQIIIFTILLGFVFFQLGNDQNSIQNRLGALFFFTINMIFTISSPLLNVFPLERKIIQKERSSGGCRTLSVFLAKSVSCIPLLVVYYITYASAIYWMIGFRPTIGAFLTFLAIVLANGLIALSLGLTIGALVKSVAIAHIIGPTVIIVFVIFGGLFINPTSIPSVLIWLYWLSPIQYAFKALSQNEFRNSVLTCKNASPCLATGNQVLKFYSLDYPSLWTCFLILLGMIVFYQFTGYLALKYATRPKRI
jgi:ABC-type multidrug transport system ATPase subunit/ABC-type multidrug transport system permease subunit